MGITKERVRQIQTRTMGKLRKAAEEERIVLTWQCPSLRVIRQANTILTDGELPREVTCEYRSAPFCINLSTGRVRTGNLYQGLG